MSENTTITGEYVATDRSRGIIPGRLFTISDMPEDHRWPDEYRQITMESGVSFQVRLDAALDMVREGQWIKRASLAY